MRKERLIGLLAMALFAGLLSSCVVTEEDDSGRVKGVAFDAETFAAEKAAWEQSGILDYAFTQYYQHSPQSLAAFPVLSTVENGSRVALQVTNSEASGDMLNNDDAASYYFSDTISGIYSRIESDVADFASRIAGSGGDLYGAAVTVTYGDNHIPVKVRYDVYTKEHGRDIIPGYDWSMSLDISDFAVTD